MNGYQPALITRPRFWREPKKFSRPVVNNKRYHIKKWEGVVYVLEFCMIKRATRRLKEKRLADGWISWNNPLCTRRYYIGCYSTDLDHDILLAKAFRIINALERGEKYESLEHNSYAVQSQLILLDGEKI